MPPQPKSWTTLITKKDFLSALCTDQAKHIQQLHDLITSSNNIIKHLTSTTDTLEKATVTISSIPPQSYDSTNTNTAEHIATLTDLTNTITKAIEELKLLPLPLPMPSHYPTSTIIRQHGSLEPEIYHQPTSIQPRHPWAHHVHWKQTLHMRQTVICHLQ